MNIDVEKLANNLASTKFKEYYQEYEFDVLYEYVDDTCTLYLKEKYAQEYSRFQKQYYDLICEYTIDE